MNPGDTFFRREDRHLWIVLSVESADGEVAIVNLTTHDPVERRQCNERCVIVGPQEHPWPEHDSCVAYRYSRLVPDPAREVDRMDAPLGPDLLRRVQQGALASRRTSRHLKSAVRREVGRG